METTLFRRLQVDGHWSGYEKREGIHKSRGKDALPELFLSLLQMGTAQVLLTFMIMFKFWAVSNLQATQVC